MHGPGSGQEPNGTPIRPEEGDEVLESEFAAVAVRVDRDANGPRLRVTDLHTGRVGYLDPLELETLAWLPEREMHKLLDPSFHRWKDTNADG